MRRLAASGLRVPVMRRHEVTSADVLFYPSSPLRAGIVLDYAVVRHGSARGEMRA